MTHTPAATPSSGAGRRHDITAKGAGTSKPIPGVGRTTEQYAVTGGTGAYAGATGAIRRTGDGRRDTLTVSFSP